MTESDDSGARQRRAGFFGVVARGQSWLNVVYLALAFPLGLFYFVALVVCLSVGVGLVIVWVGLFVLALTAAGWWLCASFERSLADTLLGTHLRPAPRPWLAAEGTLPRLKAHFSAASTWKDLAFLFVKFPLGVLSFVVLVSLGGLSAACLAAPLYYRSTRWTDAHGAFHDSLTVGAWHVDRLWEALLLVPVGVLLVFVSLHAVNGLAAMWRAVATGLLDRDTSPRPDAGAAAPDPGAPADPSAAQWPGSQPVAGDPAAAPAAAQPSPYDWPPPAQPGAWPEPWPGGQAAYPGQQPWPAQAPWPGQGAYPGPPPTPGQSQQQWPAPAWQAGPWAGQWPAWPGWPASYGPPPTQPAATPDDPAAAPPPAGRAADVAADIEREPAPDSSPDTTDEQPAPPSPPAPEEDPS